MSYFHAFINVWTTFHRKLNPFLSWLKAEFVLLKNPAQQKWWLGMDTFHLLLESHFQLFSVTPFFSRKLTSMDHSNYFLLSLIFSLSVTRESPDNRSAIFLSMITSVEVTGLIQGATTKFPPSSVS